MKKRMRGLFSRGVDTDDFFEKLEDVLIEADISARVAVEISAEVRKSLQTKAVDILPCLRQSLEAMLRSCELVPVRGELGCWLFLGVNGVGKTTSLIKLANYWKSRGHDIIVAAGDTFRAAAVKQLEHHAANLHIRCVQQGQGADPAAVIFDALESARSRGPALVMADSAGRMHNKSLLIKELQKIDRIIRSKVATDRYKKLLVIDSTTGQNAMQQAEVFHAALGIDGIVLSKYDSQARGGLALSISRQLELPFAFLATGESYNDIAPFDSAFVADRIMENLTQVSVD